MKWLILFFGVLSNAAASICIKSASATPYVVSFSESSGRLSLNIPLIVGLLLYAVALLFYILALARFPLSVAHPILTSGAISLVALWSFLVLREPLTLTGLLGLVLVLVGVTLLTFRA